MPKIMFMTTKEEKKDGINKNIEREVPNEKTDGDPTVSRGNNNSV